MRDWLKAVRTEKHLTMKDMGKKLGISESYYCAIENGTRQKKMDVTLIAALACVFEVSVSDIVQAECEGKEEAVAGVVM